MKGFIERRILRRREELIERIFCSERHCDSQRVFEGYLAGFFETLQGRDADTGAIRELLLDQISRETERFHTQPDRRKRFAVGLYRFYQSKMMR